MSNDLLDKIPQWLKSLYHMENELRNAARNGLILRKKRPLSIWPKHGDIWSRP